MSMAKTATKISLGCAIRPKKWKERAEEHDVKELYKVTIVA